MKSEGAAASFLPCLVCSARVDFFSKTSHSTRQSAPTFLDKSTFLAEPFVYEDRGSIDVNYTV